MTEVIILSIFSVQWLIILILIYVIIQLKMHIIVLENKIHGQQIAINKLQDDITKISVFLNVNTSKWSKNNTF